MKILGRGAEWPYYLFKNENIFGGNIHAHSKNNKGISGNFFH